MFNNQDPLSTLVIVAIVFVGLLFIFRFIVWWWLGIGERLQESKRTNELLEKLIAQSSQPLPPVEAPTAEAQPRRNPLTQR